VLGLGSEARINVPGVASGNWSWRLSRRLPRSSLDRLADLTETYGRASQPITE
jgi:4-alpha-glucanotransferase